MRKLKSTHHKNKTALPKMKSWGDIGWASVAIIMISVCTIYRQSKVARTYMVPPSSVSLSSSLHPLALATDSMTNQTTRDSVCDVFLGNSNNKIETAGSNNPYPSTSFVWHSLRERILNASYFPEDSAKLPAFRRWVEEVFEFHTESRLRKTRTHTADPTAVWKLLQIVKRRLEWEAQRGGSKRRLEEEEGAEPLHIMVMGGSVTAGFNCAANPVGVPAGSSLLCSWPARLEYMLNQVFFGGDSVVKITNMAAGGSSSEIGSLVMEYQLFPNQEIPHIIMSAFAPNDAKQPDLEQVLNVDVQNFIQSAKNVRPCDEDLPLVVIADHFYAWRDVTKTNRLSGYYSLLASWYDVMAFNHQNIGRHELISNSENATAIQQLMGSDYNLHMGTGFHIGMAWTALFNFLDAIVDTCNDLGITKHDQEGDRGYVDDSNKIMTKTAQSSIESILKRPSLKHLPKLLPAGVGVTTSDIVDRWNKREVEAKNRCSSIMANSNDTAAEAYAADSASLLICSHAWMVGKGTGINTYQELSRFIKPVLHSTDGWAAAGRPVQQPRTGWYAQAANATFEMRVPVIVPTHFLTIVSMKSYGPTWIGSKLEATVTIQRSGMGIGSNNNNNNNGTATPPSNTTTYEIDGFHEIKTSVHFVHKFRLPGNGAAVGDVVIVRARLLGGSTFKINGIALCRF